MKKEERGSRRNQLSVILVGWYRYRKERYCHSISYGVLLLGWVLVFLPSLPYHLLLFSSVNFPVDLFLCLAILFYKKQS